MGVWIETYSDNTSHSFTSVTPCVGVWIETFDKQMQTFYQDVTPCVGVWIETRSPINKSRFWMSHPAWVCGLKRLYWTIGYMAVSHTLRGCVDWNCSALIIEARACGHTLRGCVDWNRKSTLSIQISQSHTLRGCVDWNSGSLNSLSHLIVTPCVGVWIETVKDRNTGRDVLSHPAWVCGLKQRIRQTLATWV